MPDRDPAQPGTGGRAPFQAIETVRTTGGAMQHKYKETASGSLAIPVLPFSRAER